MTRLDLLPDAYRILPESIDLCIPGFRAHYQPGDRTLALRPRDCGAWFDGFVDIVAEACGREFLPVCRMSDGEFRFLVGDQPPDVRLPAWVRGIGMARQKLSRLKRRGSFRAATTRTVSSGAFTAEEWALARSRYGDLVREIAREGILALHLSYGPGGSFQEPYFPAFAQWLERNRIVLDDRNYVPFYFVYAALTGPRRGDWLRGRRILIVHSARGEKRARIEHRLRAEGAREVLWCTISPERAFFDQLEIQDFRGKADLAFIGAGVGKPNILTQLAPLSVPCVDVGYLFEVWADEERRWERPFCVPDEEWDPARVRFMPVRADAAAG